MPQKTISQTAGQPSFFFLMLACSCFDRARRAGHPKNDALRNFGRDYLIKATTFEPQRSRVSARPLTFV